MTDYILLYNKVVNLILTVTGKLNLKRAWTSYFLYVKILKVVER